MHGQADAAEKVSGDRRRVHEKSTQLFHTVEVPQAGKFDN